MTTKPSYVTLQNKLKILEKRLNSPKTDLGETHDHIYIRMELPVNKFKWNIKDDIYLYVTYTKEYDINQNVKIIYSETNYGTATRRVKLPHKVNNNVIYESWQDGILTLLLQKQNTNEIINEDKSINTNQTSNEEQSINDTFNNTINDTINNTFNNTINDTINNTFNNTINDTNSFSWADDDGDDLLIKHQK
jgi:HSP20 family molecular chaperone IbpA